MSEEFRDIEVSSCFVFSAAQRPRDLGLHAKPGSGHVHQLAALSA